MADKVEIVTYNKICSLLNEEVEFLQPEKIIYDKWEESCRKKMRGAKCSNAQNCIDNEINCKWSNGKGPDYLKDY